MYFNGKNPDGLEDWYYVKNITGFKTQRKRENERAVKVSDSGVSYFVMVSSEDIERLVNADLLSMTQHARLLRAGYRPDILKKRRDRKTGKKLLRWITSYTSK